MGTSQPYASIYNGNFKHKNWVVVDKTRKSIPGQPVLVQIQNTQIMADQYIVRLNYPQSFSKQSSIYQKRASSNSSCLVNIFSAELLTQKYQISGQNEIVRVRTQRISWRLCESKNLSSKQGIYILENALRGFAEVFQHFPQPVSVNDSMIGMNIFGTVRIWINPNFAKNSRSPYQKPINVMTMLQSIILTIEKHLQEFIFPHQFRLSILNSNSLSLAAMKASNYLSQSREERKQIALNILNKVNQKKESYHSSIIYHSAQRNKTKSLAKINENNTFNKSNSRVSAEQSPISYHQQSIQSEDNTYPNINKNLKQSLISNRTPNILLKKESSQLIISKSISKDSKNYSTSQQIGKTAQKYNVVYYPQSKLEALDKHRSYIAQQNNKYHTEKQIVKNRNSQRTQVEYQNNTIKKVPLSQFYPNNQHKISNLKSSQQIFGGQNRQFASSSIKNYGKNNSYENLLNFTSLHEPKSIPNKKNIQLSQAEFINKLKNGDIASNQIIPQHKVQMASSYHLDSLPKQHNKNNYISFEVKLQKSGKIKRDKILTASNVQNRKLNQSPIGNNTRYQNKLWNKSSLTKN